MKKISILFLLIFVLIGVTGCERVASVQPVLVGSTAEAANLPADTITQTLTVTPVNTSTPVGSSKIVELDSPVGQESGTVELTPTVISPIITETSVSPAVNVTLISITPTEAPTAVMVVPTEYALKKGEWAVCIARRFNLDLDAFFALNKINMQTNYLPQNFKLKIPAGTNWSTKYGARAWHSHPDVYNVKADDTIQKIACYYGDVTPEAIEKSNNLTGNYLLSAGQKLSIP
jgi:LysM repeat protein